MYGHVGSEDGTELPNLINNFNIVCTVHRTTMSFRSTKCILHTLSILQIFGYSRSAIIMDYFSC